MITLYDLYPRLSFAPDDVGAGVLSLVSTSRRIDVREFAIRARTAVGAIVGACVRSGSLRQRSALRATVSHSHSCQEDDVARVEVDLKMAASRPPDHRVASI